MKNIHTKSYKYSIEQDFINPDSDFAIDTTTLDVILHTTDV